MTTASGKTKRRIEWTFVGRDRYGNDKAPVHGAHEQHGRRVRCYDGDEIAWTNTHRSVAAATAAFDGDMRAMRKNDCYRWPV